MKKQIITTAIISVLVVGGALGYYFSTSNTNKNGHTPPTIHINYPKYQGFITGDIVCKIPGLKEKAVKSDDVSTFVAPANKTAINLSAGIHFYHADTDLTAQAILDAIQPKVNNSVLLGYLPHGKDIYDVTPPIVGQNVMTDPATYNIPANEGFVIFSCLDTKIYGVKDEKTLGAALPTILTDPNLAGKTTSWIMTSATDVNLTTALAPIDSKVNLVETWTQNGPDFNFGSKAVDLKDSLPDDYKMIFLSVAPVGATGKLTAPGSLTLSDATTNSLKLSWTAPVGNIKQYNLTCVSGCAADFVLPTLAATDTSKIIPNLTANVQYTFELTAVGTDNVAGDTAQASGSTLAGEKQVPPPSGKLDAPAGLNVSAKTSTSLTLSWTAPAGNIKQYNLTCVSGCAANFALPDVTGDKTSITISNLTKNTNYTFDLAAVDGTGIEGNLSEVSASTPDATVSDKLPAPTDFKVVSATPTSATLTWVAPLGVDATKFDGHYNLKYGPVGIDPATVDSVMIPPSIGTKYTVTDLLPGKAYLFQVDALDLTQTVDGLPATIPSYATPPSAPDKVEATSSSNWLLGTTATITWRQNTGDISPTTGKYELIYSEGACPGDITNATTVSFDAASNMDKNLADGSYTLKIPSNVLPAGTKYYFYLLASNDGKNFYPDFQALLQDAASNTNLYCHEFTTSSDSAPAAQGQPTPTPPPTIIVDSCTKVSDDSFGVGYSYSSLIFESANLNSDLTYKIKSPITDEEPTIENNLNYTDIKAKVNSGVTFAVFPNESAGTGKFIANAYNFMKSGIDTGSYQLSVVSVDSSGAESTPSYVTCK